MHYGRIHHPDAAAVIRGRVRTRHRSMPVVVEYDAGALAHVFAHVITGRVYLVRTAVHLDLRGRWCI